MVMGSLPEEVDLAIVGGGVGGYVAAIRAAERGMSVALVEKHKLGGHCLNYACIPSKSLIHISDIFYSSQHSQQFGISAEKVSIDAKKMLEWRLGVSKKLEEGVAFLCKSNDVEVYNAEATFLSSNTLQLSGGESLDFKKAIIATGSEPIELKGFGFSDRIMDYKAALLMDRIPRSMAIIGAGYVAVEIGMLYAKLGSKVSLIARSDVLSRFDADAVSIIKKKMEELRIEIYKDAQPASYDSSSLTLIDKRKVDAEAIVAAVGLRPYTKNLGIENTKVQLDEKGFIRVDDQLYTTDRNILAVGDVIGEPMLAHKAIRQGIVAADVASGIKAGFDNKVIPSVIFSDPEIAVAGSIEEKEGIEVTKFPMSAIGRAVAVGATNGFVKIAYEKGTGLLKGAEIVSREASSMISEISLAIEMGATIDDIAMTIHPHPTFSEGVQEAAEAALGFPVHFFYGKRK